MAPRRRGRRRGRGGRRGGQASLVYEFAYQANVQPDGVFQVTYGKLGIDASRPSRVQRVSVEMCTAHGATAAASIAIYGPRVSTGTSSRSVVNRSRVMAIGSTARSMSVSVPGPTDYATPDLNDVAFHLDFTASQAGSGDQNVHIMVTGRAVVQFERRSIPHLIK